jgi:hypothetical protein
MLVTPPCLMASPHSPRNSGARLHRTKRLLIACVLRYPVPLLQPLADLLFRTLQVNLALNLRRAVIMCQRAVRARVKADLPAMEPPSRVRAQAPVPNSISRPLRPRCLRRITCPAETSRQTQTMRAPKLMFAPTSHANWASVTGN